MIVTAHQPNYLPYLGLFDKISRADLFLVMDDVQFSPRGFTNRNKIKTPQGAKWLTVPIKSDKIKPINEIEISNEKDWKKKHFDTIDHMYKKSPHYEDIKDLIISWYSEEWVKLSDLNCKIIFDIMKFFEIEVKIEFTSNISIKETNSPSDRILELCKAVEASEYLSGSSGKDYLITKDFSDQNIEIAYHSFNHPVYPQRFGEFIPNLSIIDYLCNVGNEKWF